MNEDGRRVNGGGQDFQMSLLVYQEERKERGRGRGGCV